MKVCRVLLLILALFTYTCGGTGGGVGTSSLPASQGGAPPATGDDDSGTSTTSTSPASMTFVASPSTINYLELSTITATVLDGTGASVPDGTVVTFSVSPAGYGAVTAQDITVNGVATATFTAANTTGTVVITASTGGISKNVSVKIEQTGAPASINLTALPAALTVQGTASITATVLDNLGANVPDGTTVTFSVSPSGYGLVTTQATTVSGVATATLLALNTPGTVVVTGSAGGVSDTASIVISAAATGSLEFCCATPTVIGISGSGQTETSLILFLVKDINGNNVVDGTSVSFTMSGPSGGRLPSAGGEYLGTDDGTPTTASASTVDGVAGVYLHSGSVAGPVLVIATVAGMSSASTGISIGGGIPNDAHLTLTTNKFNLEGLDWANIQANISVFMADRFGNYNILENTAVSFYAESGAIDRNAVTDDGSATVVFRTQNPIPYDVQP
ncbi:hypothetical protein, partial [Candidatus Magnetobacterium casense]